MHLSFKPATMPTAVVVLPICCFVAATNSARGMVRRHYTYAQLQYPSYKQLATVYEGNEYEKPRISWVLNNPSVNGLLRGRLDVLGEEVTKGAIGVSLHVVG